MNEDTILWDGKPIVVENIKCENIRPTLELTYFLDKYQFALHGVNVSIDLDKLISLGIIKPE